MIYLFAFFLFFLFELIYFSVSKKFGIVDKPNERSLHSSLIIRGGGIIFPISAFFFYITFGYQYLFFFLGLFLIAVISFLDDIFTLANRYRIVIQLISAVLLLFQLDIFIKFGVLSIFLLFFIIGVINAYNFMDGINGITGGYSLINLISFALINIFSINFINNDFLILIILGVLVFVFFNFRKNAKCFAGDVGSISMAFILLFILGSLWIKSGQYVYLLFLVVYGVDTFVTLMIRLLNRENIFEAHNQHLFQILVRKRGLSHLTVSVIYICIQLFVNFITVFMAHNYKNGLSIFIIFIIPSLMIVHLLVRRAISISLP